jgi:hypothetical protein
MRVVENSKSILAVPIWKVFLEYDADPWKHLGVPEASALKQTQVCVISDQPEIICQRT